MKQPGYFFRATWWILTLGVALGQTQPAPYLEPVPAPEAGKYTCVILSELPAVQISPSSPPTTIVSFPSALGDLNLDGKGHYQLSKGSKGNYLFNATEGTLRFDGNLAALPNRYRVLPGTFEITFTYQGTPKETPQSHYCSLKSPRAIPPKVANLNGGLRGLLTGSSGSGGNVVNSSVVEFDLTTAQGRVRFAGAEAYRAENGETVYINLQKNVVLAKIDGTTANLFDTNNTGLSDNGLSTRLYPALAPDGSKIAYADHVAVLDATLATIDRDGFHRVVVLARDGQFITSFAGMTQPTWTPDGRLVMVGAKAENGSDRQAKTGLYLADKALSKIIRFDPNLDNPQMPSVRPDGSLVAFVYGNALWVVRLNSLGLQKLEDRTQIYWPTWSPDGKYIAAWGKVEYERYQLGYLALKQPNPKTFTDAFGNPVEGYPNRFTWRSR